MWTLLGRSTLPMKKSAKNLKPIGTVVRYSTVPTQKIFKRQRT